MWIERITGLLAILVLSACASWQRPPVVDVEEYRQRATVSESEGVTVRALVLSPSDSEQLFGADVNSHDIEPVWLEITNGSGQQLSLLQTGSDPDYFSALEVAWSLHGNYSREGKKALDEHLQSVAFSRGVIERGETRSGVIFTNPHVNIKLLNVDLLGRNRFVSITLFLPIPDEQGNFVERTVLRYDSDGVPEYATERQLMLALEGLFKDSSGMFVDGLSEPLNLVWVGRREDVAAALVRRGYRWESHSGDEEETLFDRQPLSVMRKWGQAGTPENWIRFWEMPIRFQGRSVFVAQTAAPRGGRFATKWKTPSTDPAVDHARDMLVQDMLFSGGLAKLSVMHHPGLPDKFSGVTDGRIAVFFIAARPLDLDDIQLADWGDVDWLVEPDPYTKRAVQLKIKGASE